jgi:hypothetical protein
MWGLGDIIIDLRIGDSVGVIIIGEVDGEFGRDEIVGLLTIGDGGGGGGGGVSGVVTVVVVEVSASISMVN